MQTNRLIALVDSSSYAESVCYYAAFLARKQHHAVRLYHVVAKTNSQTNQDLSGAIKLGARTALLEQLTRLDEAQAKLANTQGRAILDDARDILTSQGVSDVETRLRQGELVESVIKEETQGDIIVLGKRGVDASKAMDHIGSNLERIVRASHRPVFVANRAFQPFDDLLIAYDGGTSSQKILDYLVHNPSFNKHKITLVYVGHRSDWVDGLMRNACQQLENAGYITGIHLQDGEPENVLATMTDAKPQQLLMMGAYGHSRIRNLIIGSTTTAMIRSCKVPIFIIK
jgi:nucleotide-binding universal stress UspA family protein